MNCPFPPRAYSTTNSARRFCALSSGVLLASIGFDEPNPVVVSRPASSPNCDSRISLTVPARCLDRTYSEPFPLRERESYQISSKFFCSNLKSVIYRKTGSGKCDFCADDWSHPPGVGFAGGRLIPIPCLSTKSAERHGARLEVFTS